MTVSLSTVHITVDDPEAALAFYRDTLGLTVTLDVSNEGFRWITLTTDTQPEVGIVLSQPHGRTETPWLLCWPRGSCTRCTFAARTSMPPSRRSPARRELRCCRSLLRNRGACEMQPFATRQAIGFGSSRLSEALRRPTIALGHPSDWICTC
jgi:hypothetical protein